MEQIKQTLKGSKFYGLRIVIETMLDNTVGLINFQYQKRDNLFNWFYNTLKEQHVIKANQGPKYNYYEFGVAGGGSMKIYALALKKFCSDFDMDINDFHIYGFDSFQGLPNAEEADKKEGWSKGEMSHEKTEVLEKLRDINFPMNNVKFIEGFYDASLTPALREEMKKNPPAIVNMDADYYSSTKTVFDWLLPFAPTGTMFRFDDLWSFYGHPEKGVIKAIYEVNTSDNGWLTPFPSLGLAGLIYVFARKKYEYTGSDL